MLRLHGTFPRYAFVAGVVVLVSVVRYAMMTAGVGDRAPFLLFMLAIVIAAWIGGTGPGLAATVLSSFLVALVFIPPAWRLALLTPEDWIELTLFAVQAGVVSWLIGSRRELFERLGALNEQLEQRVAARTAELQAANVHLREQADERERDHQVLMQLNTRLGQSNRELQDFASVASHDLQEPLRKIQAFGDRLSTRFGDRLEGGGQDYLDRMLKAAERMSVLINDLLTFSRVTSKAQPFVPCDLGMIASDVVSDLEARIEDVGAEVEVGELPTVSADPLQMRQLLQNLTSNALKFHRPGARPRVRIWAEGPEPARGATNGVGNLAVNGEAAGAEAAAGGDVEVVRLYVSDNGIGFEEKYLDRIFNVFQRLHGRSDFEGTGIGLAVCRKIAQRHGGDVTAHSRPGEGATFVVTLPVHPPGAEDARTSSGETHYDFVGR